MENDDITEKLITAIRNYDMDYVNKKVGSIDHYYDMVSDPFFQVIANVLVHPEFPTLEYSYSFLMCVFSGGMLDYFTEQQRTELVDIFVKIFPSMQASNSHWIIAEYIVESFCDDRSLQALLRLTKVEVDKLILDIFHGYVHLVESCTDEIIIHKAYDELLLMLKDESESVRNEARNTLHLILMHLKDSDYMKDVRQI